MRYSNILDTIGNTPIVKIQKLNPNPSVGIFAKLEGNNPGGSVKDRIAKFMVEEAEKKGILRPGKTLLEATSGNTGIGLAMVAAFKGYKFTAVMPKSASIERRKLLKAYGAKIVLTDFSQGVGGAIKTANQMLKENKNYVILDQFNNSDNALTHYETTGVEIIKNVPEIDVFVAGMGTGGTLMGVAKRLKKYNSYIKIVGVEPYPKTKIQGLRNMEIYTPSIFDMAKLDQKIVVKDKDAFQVARLLFLKEGISAGISSGAAMWGAIKMASKMKKGTIVVLFPDRGERYLSLGLFA
ncbi:cysteine synthase family protein [Candidatus Microgenomates bacterium]|nr:cysteine synthase family protein [Candidatus Microgenomates bacterium]